MDQKSINLNTGTQGFTLKHSTEPMILSFTLFVGWFSDVAAQFKYIWSKYDSIKWWFNNLNVILFIAVRLK